MASYALPRNWKLASDEDVAEAMSAMASGAEEELSPDEQQAIMADESDEAVTPDEAAEALEQEEEGASESKQSSKMRRTSGDNYMYRLFKVDEPHILKRKQKVRHSSKTPLKLTFIHQELKIMTGTYPLMLC